MKKDKKTTSDLIDYFDRTLIGKKQANRSFFTCSKNAISCIVSISPC